MSNSRQLAEQFLKALAANDAANYTALLDEQAGLRMWHWRGQDVRRPRERVVARLMEEWSAWPDASVETFDIVADDERAAIEFRIQVTENERFVEHNRSAFLAFQDGKIGMIDMYCPEPLPSAHRKHWIAPATLSAEEMKHLLEALNYVFDVREWTPPNSNWNASLRGGRGGTGDAHPGSNGVGGMRWNASEADQKIEELIAYHRERNIGFQWYVGPFDTPPDLRERLERHGLVLAGEQMVMARMGLDNLAIPSNSSASVEVVDGSSDEAIEACLQIIARSFSWTPEQVAERRPGFFESHRNPRMKEKEISYLARLDGVPVATARLVLRGGIAYLGGAATLPEYRGQKLYSTLLRRRMEDAHARGYQVAAIHAEPMSRRVVSRYDFKEYARSYIYAWMPVIDMAVIKSLVPDE